MKPFYFGDCFGWLHGATGKRGVVICPAFGVEELCTHRFMRHLADEIAAAGMPALRFDYQGTGDSRGDDTDPDRVQQWLDSIKQAVECLKKVTGVNEVALVGLRLGTLLATEVASQLEAVSMLALLAPVTSGKSYVREMKVLARLIAQGTRPAEADSPPTQMNGIEVAGFQMTDATISSLQRFDLTKVAQPPAQRVLIMGRRNAGPETQLAEHFRSLGCVVEQTEFPGFDELVWDTSFAALPDNAFASAVQWLSQDLQLNSDTQIGSAATILVDADWSEDPLQFGDNNKLFGIRCQPLNTHPRFQRGRAVVFVNHGSNHRIGWARMHVKLCRRFAAQGLTSLRIDISGVGDSPARPGYAENQLYARHSQADIHAALDWLQTQGYQQITLVGHCAGAHLGFYATVRDVRVTNLIILNLQRFFWARGESLEDVSRKIIKSSGWYRSMLRDPQVWRRLLTARINVAGIVSTLLQRLLQRGYGYVIHFVGPLIGKEGLSRKVIRWLSELSARGTRVLLVYSAEDSGLDEIANYAGTGGRALSKLSNVQLRVIDGADHNMTSMWAQESYARVLEEFLFKD